MSTGTVTILTDAKRSAAEVEHFAAQLTGFPGPVHVLAVERIRSALEYFARDDADRLAEIRNVLAGLDLAVQRRQAAR